MSDSRKIIMAAGFGLLAFLLMKQMNGQPRQIVANRPVQTGNRNPYYSLALPAMSQLSSIFRSLPGGYVSPVLSASNSSGVPGVYPGSQQDILLAQQWNESMGWNSVSGLPGLDYGSQQDLMLADQWSW